MKKVYLSGRISGNESYLCEFAHWEQQLSALGFSVINQARILAAMPQDATYTEYMRISMALLEISDYIFMIPGWGKSKGAKLEKHYADVLGKEEIYADFI